MSLLQQCTKLWGTAKIHDGDPMVEILRDGFFLPFSHGMAWGLFRGDGSAVAAAVDFREGTLLAPDQLLTTTLSSRDISEIAPDGTYLYGGRINPHFGHFLVNTLPRFWAMAKLRSPSTRILCHGPGTPEGWFGVPFIAAAFGLLGLSPRDFATFNRPTRVARVVVPRSAFEEQHAGYRAYRTLCRAIGERALAGRRGDLNGPPVYYSKSRLRSGVGVVTNEVEIEEVMQAAGVRIVYPEAHSLIDQIQLMSSAERIFGTAGSFLHASIFCPPRHITCINTIEMINSNYTIIDALAENQATYHYPPALRVLDQQENFITSRYLPDAAAVASNLLDVAA